MNSYEIGDTVRLAIVFQAPDGGEVLVDTDPTTITLKVRTPAGVETPYTYLAGEVTRTATGRYRKDVLVTEAGTWSWRWEGTGAVAEVDEGVFYVLPTVFSVP